MNEKEFDKTSIENKAEKIPEVSKVEAPKQDESLERIEPPEQEESPEKTIFESQEDTEPTRLFYDTGGLPWFIVLAWFSILLAYATYMIMFAFPDLLLWFDL